jgi:hypothetical protein
MLNSMAERSNDANELILDLTSKTQKTARSMQTLTFLTLIYLPPSLIAVRSSLSLENLLADNCGIVILVPVWNEFLRR